MCLKSSNLGCFMPNSLIIRFPVFYALGLSCCVIGKLTYKSSVSVVDVPIRVPMPGLEMMVSASSEEWADIGMRYLVRMFFIEWNWLGAGS